MKEMLEELIILNRQKCSLKFFLGKCYGEDTITSIAESYKLEDRVKEVEKEIDSITSKLREKLTQL